MNTARANMRRQIELINTRRDPIQPVFIPFCDCLPQEKKGDLLYCCYIKRGKCDRWIWPLVVLYSKPLWNSIMNLNVHGKYPHHVHLMVLGGFCPYSWESLHEIRRIWWEGLQWRAIELWLGEKKPIGVKQKTNVIYDVNRFGCRKIKERWWR